MWKSLKLKLQFLREPSDENNIASSWILGSNFPNISKHVINRYVINTVLTQKIKLSFEWKERFRLAWLDSASGKSYNNNHSV